MLGRLLAAVRPGGVLAATVKQGVGEAWRPDKLASPRHFTYWNDTALQAVSAAAGWSAIAVVDSTTATSREPWWTLTARRPA